MKTLFTILMVATILISGSSFASTGKPASEVATSKVFQTIQETIQNLSWVGRESNHPIAKNISFFKKPQEKIFVGLKITF